MRRQCIKCGAQFERRYKDQVLCEACAAQSKANFNKLKDRTCHTCGTIFKGGSRAWYCPTCRAERQILASRRHRQHPGRKIGSIDHCENCGKEYIVNGGLQRYCPECAPEMVKRIKRDAARERGRQTRDQKALNEMRALSNSVRICEICGKPFPAENAILFNLDICSTECLAKYRAKNEATVPSSPPRGNIAVSEVVAAYREEKNITHVAEKFGISTVIVRKCLATYDMYDVLAPVAKKVRDMYDRGIKTAIIAQTLRISFTTAYSYEPYENSIEFIKAPRKSPSKKA